ncbi:hypothetical protein B0A78_03570 [Flavobacterium columnare NBRC 100251 = ATCC 23463]|uniref:hypothetical protein n=1 Tax=Flavobacterium columnare TaxID=996 RepID=UPI000B5BA448|nr:hypothetical protein [Flavobacterium columnare]OXA83664.1 hypothetical protein B0A56_00655 [Flavobacterium columnare NBRC 100251 = ATCC 23463]PDS26097.1 hypothetical protein B0A78_03570 [Flavobacterium columnare NBRC 100251 = ATCC 23463]QHJ72934.1 hypothetical protein [Flavobacterium phage fF4]GEM58443.1 hypothetical protein FC1_16810 [Flavobacterium columnare NBRC 100251 = ATCC 23463]
MNKQNFNQSGGFPLETEVLADMQESFSIFNSLGNIAGNFAIISGCEETNGFVSNGVVFINGEVLEFRGGNVSSTVIIVENRIKKEFENGEEKEVLCIRYATFGIGSVTFNWADFKRPKSTIELTSELKTVNEELPKKADKTIIQRLIDRITELEKRPTFNNPIKNKGYFTLGDITGGQPVGSNLPVFGDCVSAVVASYVDGGNHYIDVSFLNTMPSVNYKVNLMVESLGTISNDDDAGNPIFKIIDTNKFKVGLYEATSTVQSIRIHFEITEL